MKKSSKPSSKQSREKLIAGAAELLSRRGLNATSIRELAKYSNAPLGSTYHYFPGGKYQVVTEAIEYVGKKVTQALQDALALGPLEGVVAFLAIWRHTVIESDFQAGCPVLSVAVEEPSSEEEIKLLQIAASIFSDWQHLLTESMESQGVEQSQAESVATLVVASVEGTVAMCRAARSTEPLDQVSKQLSLVISTALESAHSQT